MNIMTISFRQETAQSVHLFILVKAFPACFDNPLVSESFVKCSAKARQHVPLTC